MRKIETKEEIKKRSRKNQIILGIILVAVMFFSVLGYGFQTQGDDNFSGNENKVVYNGLEFIKSGSEYWSISFENFKFTFKNNPNEVEEIVSEIKPLNNYVGKPLYIYSENKEAEYEIYRNLDPIILRRQYACLNGENVSVAEDFDLNNCDAEWPIKTCNDNFIIVKESNISEIIQENNCIFINAKKEDLIKVTDEFLFKILGIRQ